MNFSENHQNSSLPLPVNIRKSQAFFNMKLIAILALCIASALATPYGYGPSSVRKEAMYSHSHVETLSPSLKLDSKPVVPIVRQEMHDDNKGTYRSDVQTGDGSTFHESGSLKDIGSKEGPAVVKEGSYSWTSPEGQTFTVNWTSDERGFVAHGAHLPVAPPVPEEILKSLALPRIPEYQEPIVRSSLYSSRY